MRMDKVAAHINQVPFSLETIEAMGSPLTIYGRCKKPHKVLGASQPAMELCLAEDEYDS